MIPLDDLFSVVSAINGNSPVPAITQAIESCVSSSDHWISRMAVVTTVLGLALPEWPGISLYVAGKPAGELWLIANHGGPCPVFVAWGVPVVGLAASERAVQIVSDIARFSEYRNHDANVAAEVAIPVVRGKRLRAVLDARAVHRDQLDLGELELLVQAGSSLASAWPETAGDRHV